MSRRKLRLLGLDHRRDLEVLVNLVVRRGYTMRSGIESSKSSKARRWVGVGSVS